jgi:exosortase
MPRGGEGSIFKALLDPWTLACLVIPGTAMGALLVTEAYLLMQKQHMQFAPLAIGAAVWFLSEKQTGPIRQRSYAGLMVGSLLGWLLAGLALIAQSSWLAHFTMVYLVWIWALGRLRQHSFLRLTGICGLMAVTIPLPMGLDHQLIQWLQWVSSSLCSALLDVFRVVHLRRGNIIEIPSKTLFVEEACSGVDSQYALMAIAGALLILGRASWIVSLLTIVTVPIWAIFGNLLRIFAIAIGLEWFGVDLASGTVHTVLGLVTFGLAAWAHWSSVQFLNYWESRLLGAKTIEARSGPDELESSQRSVLGGCASTPASHTMALDRRMLLVPALLVILAPPSFAGLVRGNALPTIPSLSEEVADQFPDSRTLASNCEPLRFRGFVSQKRSRGDMLGEHSRIWQFSGSEGDVTASLDFLFRGWHPLWECYMGSGWERVTTQVVEITDPWLGFEFPFYESLLRNQEGELAVLHFSLFDKSGSPYVYRGDFQHRHEASLRRRLLQIVRPSFTSDDEPLTLQFQTLTRVRNEPDEERMEQMRNIFLKLRAPIFSESKSELGKLP